MSRPEQATLADAVPEPQQRPDWARIDGGDGRQQCQTCGAHVTPDFVRVFGGPDGAVHACPRCSTKGAIRRGAAADPDFQRRVER